MKQKLCTTHSNNYDELEKVIINSLTNMCLKYINKDKIKNNALNNLDENNKINSEKELEILTSDIKQINDNLDIIYIDKLNKKITEESKIYPVRSYYCNLYLQYEYFEKTGEMHFTPPVQTVYSTIQALKEYFEEGELNKWERHKRVFEEIHKGLAELGFKDVIKREWQAGLVVSVLYPNDKNWDFEKIHDYCYEKGFTIYPGKIASTNTFRLCSLGAIDVDDIKAFFKVFKEALEKYEIAIPVKY